MIIRSSINTSLPLFQTNSHTQAGRSLSTYTEGLFAMAQLFLIRLVVNWIIGAVIIASAFETLDTPVLLNGLTVGSLLFSFYFPSDSLSDFKFNFS